MEQRCLGMKTASLRTQQEVDTLVWGWRETWLGDRDSEVLSIR